MSYVPGTSSTIDRNLFWVDRKGTATPIPALPPGLYNDVRISPDGSRVAIVVGSSGSGDIWIYDTHSTAFERFTHDQTNATPTWSRDGKVLFYASIDPSGGKTTFFKRPIDKSQEAVVVGAVSARAYLDALDLHEQVAYLAQYNPKTGAGTQVVSLPLGGARRPCSVARATHTPPRCHRRDDGLRIRRTRVAGLKSGCATCRARARADRFPPPAAKSRTGRAMGRNFSIGTTHA